MKRGRSFIFGGSLAIVIFISNLALKKSHPVPLLLPGQSYAVPFQVGERLRYEITWKPLFVTPAFKAGELHLMIKESHYQQKPTYTISAQALSEGALSKIVGLEVKDSFESIIDRYDFRPYRTFKQTRRGKRKRDLQVLFDYDLDQSTVRETDLSLDPAKQIRDETIKGLPVPIADLLSIFYVARLRIMKQGQQFFIYLADAGKVRRINIEVQSKHKVQTPIGQFQSFQISTTNRIFKGGGELRIWYSKDSFRVPVYFEADVRFGSIYGQLIMLETEGISRGLVHSD